MPAPKNYVKIKYPRKCLCCDYTANNPQMWHMHMKTHDAIPKNKLCDQGCGRYASFINTKGRYLCCKVTQQCEAYAKEHSERVKKQWENDDERKDKTRTSFIQRLHNKETVKRQIITKRKKFGTLDPEKAKNFSHYARYVREKAQKWAKSQGFIIGKQTYHVDHKLCVLDAWNLNIPENIVNHPTNLQILPAKENYSKGSKSSITIEQLYEMIKASCEQE